MHKLAGVLCGETAANSFYRQVPGLERTLAGVTSERLPRIYAAALLAGMRTLFVDTARTVFHRFAAHFQSWVMPL